MPTIAPHQNQPGPVLVPLVRQNVAGFPLAADNVNLTIRRITKTHHGRTLQMLGHAAEHLVHNRQFAETRTSSADDEAIGILKRLSSAVFLEYAESTSVQRPLEDFVMRCANWLLE